MKHEIPAIYFLNLEEKKHRFDKFAELGITRFNAVDSRNNYSVCKNYNLTLDPVGICGKLYFAQCPGAVGAFCSFFKIWKKIIREDIPFALILEDDARFTDVRRYLNDNKKIELHTKLIQDFKFDFIQLGFRCSESWTELPYNFDGMEAHLISNAGAKKLISFVEDPSIFNNFDFPKTMGSFNGEDPNEMWFFNNDFIDWGVKDTISCAVDKLIGYASHKEIVEEKRVNLVIDPCVSLFNKSQGSDILSKGKTLFSNMSQNEITHLIFSEDFRNLFPQEYIRMVEVYAKL